MDGQFFMGIGRIFHGHGDKFSWASAYKTMGMEIHNDEHQNFSAWVMAFQLTPMEFYRWHNVCSQVLVLGKGL